jgi:hypothetical protein
MSYVTRGESALEYLPCRYGTSKLLFRGPRRKTDTGYVGVLGGSETYGRFIERPFPMLVEAKTGQRMINFGYVNAGVDVFLQDRSVLDICAEANATVIQLLGAQNLTNRFYAVHPRRNDRFLSASQFLQTLYRDVDFTEYNFTRHLLADLQDRSAEKFLMVSDELKAAWVVRMKQLLESVGGKKILLWIGEEAPGDGTVINANAPDPLFVTRAMIDEIRPLTDDFVEVVASPEARANGTTGMVFESEDAQAAATAPNVAVHQEVANQLSRALDRLLG